MARSTIEEAQNICNANQFTLIQYSGMIQRQKSTVRCNLCGNDWDVVIGTLKSGKRKCPACKGQTKSLFQSAPNKHPMQQLIEWQKEQKELEKQEAHRRKEIDTRIEAKYRKEIAVADTVVAYWRHQVARQIKTP